MRILLFKNDQKEIEKQSTLKQDHDEENIVKY